MFNKIKGKRIFKNIKSRAKKWFHRDESPPIDPTMSSNEAIDINYNLRNPKLVQLVNTLSGINLDTIQPPRMVVVGTQSSGKSSLLNGIMGLEILPTGKNMVTRSPLVLELNNNSSTSYAVFGDYEESGNFVERTRINLDNKMSLLNIHNQIEIITKEIAGDLMRITKQPIYLRIYGPNVPMMTLIDLPGLTNVAREDQGQPADIKNQVRELVRSYIDEPNTIIMCVMAARSDLETDMGLDLVKDIDRDGSRTIGILTKVDLMSRDGNIEEYLNGTCSTNLRLKYQYYAVRNKTSEERNLRIAKLVETEYFNNQYPNLRDRTGTDVVTKQLSSILMSKIQEALPNLKNRIVKETNEIEAIFKDIGTHIPTDSVSETLSVLDSTILSQLVRSLNRELNSAGTKGVYGSKLRQLFCEYRKNIRNNYVDPTIEELNIIISNSQGNHMDFAVSPITIVEYCMLNGAFKSMKNDSIQLVDSIVVCLNELILEILGKAQTTQRFPAFMKEIIQIINEQVWDKTMIRNSIDDLIEIESSYLWTESNIFREALNTNPSENEQLVEHVQRLCRLYQDTVQDTFGNLIPKMCMKYLVINSQNLDFICKQYLQTYSIERFKYLLAEDLSIVEKRNKLDLKYRKLKAARNILLKY
jgi:GTP-binding protein EngB required for normal cell division